MFSRIKRMQALTKYDSSSRSLPAGNSLESILISRGTEPSQTRRRKSEVVADVDIDCGLDAG
jgi:hypothetical protein